LNQPAPANLFSGQDAVIHCAYSAEKKDIRNTNIAGTRQWYEAAKKAGVRTQLFFSSCSALERAKTDYGIIKFKLENYFLQQGEPVIKPGLILGTGGLFMTMIRLIKSLPVVPLVDGGRHRVPIISMETVIKVTEKVLIYPRPGTCNLYQPEFVKMKFLMKIIRKVLDKRCFFFPFPSALIKTIAMLFEMFKIPLPISTDSLTGLKEFRRLKEKSSLSKLGITDPDPETLIRGIIKRME
jgi:nucleoside-diphosphate-sugar epimerase